MAAAQHEADEGLLRRAHEDMEAMVSMIEELRADRLKADSIIDNLNAELRELAQQASNADRQCGMLERKLESTERQLGAEAHRMLHERDELKHSKDLMQMQVSHLVSLCQK